MTLAAAARQLGLNRNTLANAAKRKDLEAEWIDPFWITTLEAVEAWREKRKTQKKLPGPKPGSESAKRSGRWGKKEDT